MITTVHKIYISFRPPEGTTEEEVDYIFRDAYNKIPGNLHPSNWIELYGTISSVSCECYNEAKAYTINKILYRFLDQERHCRVDV